MNKDYLPDTWRIIGNTYVFILKDAEFFFVIVFLNLKKMIQYPKFSRILLQKIQTKQ